MVDENDVPLFINISDIATKLLIMRSVYQAASNEPDVTLLALVLRKLAHLSMLFILELVCTDHIFIFIHHDGI